DGPVARRAGLRDRRPGHGRKPGSRRQLLEPQPVDVQRGVGPFGHAHRPGERLDRPAECRDRRHERKDRCAGPRRYTCALSFPARPCRTGIRKLTWMALEVEPPELARLVDFAECARVDGWSLRAALVRYAQPEPERAGRLLEVVRRAQGALDRQAKLLQRDGPAIWPTVSDDSPAPAASHREVTALLVATVELAELGDR